MSETESFDYFVSPDYIEGGQDIPMTTEYDTNNTLGFQLQDVEQHQQQLEEQQQQQLQLEEQQVLRKRKYPEEEEEEEDIEVGVEYIQKTESDVIQQQQQFVPYEFEQNEEGNGELVIPSGHEGQPVYCICRTSNEDSDMVCCDRCDEW